MLQTRKVGFSGGGKERRERERLSVKRGGEVKEKDFLKIK